MQSGTVVHFVWPEINFTVSIVAFVLMLVIFVLGAFSGARANKVRVVFAVLLSTLIGWFVMPLAVKAASAINISDTKAGVVIIVTIMLLLVSAVATSIYEIITVTFPDIGMKSKP